jgi:hypothetical protein
MTDGNERTEVLRNVLSGLGDIVTDCERHDDPILRMAARELWALYLRLDAWLHFLSSSSDTEEQRRFATKVLSQIDLEQTRSLLAQIALPDDATLNPFSDAAKKALDELAEAIERRVTGKIEERLKEAHREPLLENYAGRLCVAVKSDVSLGIGLGGEQRCPELIAGSRCVMEVWLQPILEEDPDPAVTSDQVIIKNGRDVPEVVFRFKPDSDTIHFDPPHQTVSVPAQGRSQQIGFRFIAPRLLSDHEAWMVLYQGNRLIQSVRVSLVIKPRGFRRLWDDLATWLSRSR